MGEPNPVDLFVFGGTAPALVTAVRAARQGLRVILATPTGDPCGSLPSLGAIETHYRGVRAPLLQEFIDAIRAHYRSQYGENSEPYKTAVGGRMLTFEPKIADAILRGWIAAEPGIRWLADHTLAGVEREGRRINAVYLRSADGTRRIAAASYVEGGYEGDLMAATGVDFRIGREDRMEFGEPRAGRLFTRWLVGVFPRAAAEGTLALTTSRATTSEPLPGSTGVGDDNIQSYSYRLCLTDDPGNRVSLVAPPSGYNRAHFAPLLLPPVEKERFPLPFHHRFLLYSLLEMAEKDHVFHGHALPNRKRSWNATNLTGGAKRYPAATPEERASIARRHREHALGLMWFLQHDLEVPAVVRQRALDWGLARDEFIHTENMPGQLYIREARRMRGRVILTEHDALAAPGQARAPVKNDSVAITEFSLDSLACSTDRQVGTGALCDGQLFQMENSRPGHVPFGVLLPRDVDNLLVVTTVSATHVAWGSIRQTPTLMHLAESAAWAAVLARRNHCAPAEVPVAQLQRTLLENGVMLSFFNDCDMAIRAEWIEAVQLAGTRDFFPDYNCCPNALLDSATAKRWADRGMHPNDMLDASGNRATRAVACLRWYRRQKGGDGQ